MQECSVVGHARPAEGADLHADGYSTCDDDCDDEDESLNLDDTDGDGYSTCDDDCDDDDESLNLDDMDGDGYSTCEGDCDDEDDSTYPGAAYVESASECMTDVDGDGWGESVPSGDAVAGIDCDDTDDTQELNCDNMDCYADTYDSTYYVFCEDAPETEWEDVSAICEDLDGHLLRTDTSAESDWVFDVASTVYTPRDNLYWLIDARDLSGTGNWTWSDGSSMGFAWPDGGPSPSGGDEYCASIKSIGGHWNDHTCTEGEPDLWGFICEIP